MPKNARPTELREAGDDAYGSLHPWRVKTELVAPDRPNERAQAGLRGASRFYASLGQAPPAPIAKQAKPALRPAIPRQTFDLPPKPVQAEAKSPSALSSNSTSRTSTLSQSTAPTSPGQPPEKEPVRLPAKNAGSQPIDEAISRLAQKPAAHFLQLASSSSSKYATPLPPPEPAPQPPGESTIAPCIETETETETERPPTPACRDAAHLRQISTSAAESKAARDMPESPLSPPTGEHGTSTVSIPPSSTTSRDADISNLLISALAGKAHSISVAPNGSIRIEPFIPPPAARVPSLAPAGTAEALSTLYSTPLTDALIKTMHSTLQRSPALARAPASSSADVVVAHSGSTPSPHIRQQSNLSVGRKAQVAAVDSVVGGLRDVVRNDADGEAPGEPTEGSAKGASHASGADERITGASDAPIAEPPEAPTASAIEVTAKNNSTEHLSPLAVEPLALASEDQPTPPKGTSTAEPPSSLSTTARVFVPAASPATSSSSATLSSTAADFTPMPKLKRLKATAVDFAPTASAGPFSPSTSVADAFVVHPTSTPSFFLEPTAYDDTLAYSSPPDPFTTYEPLYVPDQQSYYVNTSSGGMYAVDAAGYPLADAMSYGSTDMSWSVPAYDQQWAF